MNKINAHKLKTVPYLFEDVWSGKKRFEVRFNDREFKVGDTLILVPLSDDPILKCRAITATIIYMLSLNEVPGFTGTMTGAVVLGLDSIVLIESTKEIQ